MKRGYLSQYFESVVAKRLSAVEADTEFSNQHEFNGTKELKLVLKEGTGEKVSFPAIFLWFGNENEGISNEGFVTWYDARLNHPTRSEYRLYFPTTDVSRLAREGDYMFVAKRTDGSLMIVITASGCTIENQLFWLFGLDKPTGNLFEFSAIGSDNDSEIGFAARFILDELGIEVEEPEADKLDQLLQKFQGELPSTLVFSEFARSTIDHINPLDDPDAALVSWMDQEEKLFRRIERQMVSERLQNGFTSEEGADVDGFIFFSLQVQNRRKSRAGFALENHLEAIFNSYQLRYNRGVVTENKSKPDFLFPGISEYKRPDYPVELLTMLAAKTTLKDRWRQVTAEALRIPDKHLLTLEPGISLNQTDEMKIFNVRLVIPSSIQPTYLPDQRTWLINLREFIDMVKVKQTH